MSVVGLRLAHIVYNYILIDVDTKTVSGVTVTQQPQPTHVVDMKLKMMQYLLPRTFCNVQEHFVNVVLTLKCATVDKLVITVDFELFHER